jgi:hypothetical protein
MRDLRIVSALTQCVRRRNGGPAGNDHGAIGVLVAIFLAAGVLFGMGAMVIDVGRLYQNRAELQNGADAGALAVAQQCSTGSCSETSAKTLAGTYANENASKLTGNTAAIDTLCGTASGLDSCGTTAPQFCPPNLSGSFVDVITTTQVGGSHLLPPIFAQTLLSGYNGTQQKICAQATWGVSDALGVTICSAWEASSAGKMVPYPVTAAPPISDEVTFSLDNAACNGAPGNVGWTNPSSALNCNTVINGTTYGGSTGASNNNSDCATRFSNAWTNGSTADWTDAVVFIPMFSNVTNPGSNATYTLAGYIGFVVTSYNVPSMGMSGSGKGNSAQDWLNPSGGCQKNNKCITGFFVNQTLPAQAEGGISLSG